ncbi:MAG: CvpA family protein [Planctomycetales bacterium]
MEFHLYDVFMLIVLAAATIFGAWKGMAWQVASLSSLIVSYGAALRGSSLLAPHLGAEAPWNRFLAMFIIYLACSAAIWILFQYVSKFIERVKLQEFDRQVGAIIGFTKGAVICLAITFFTVTLSLDARQSILQSRSGHVAAVVMDRAHAVMPDELHNVLGPYIHQLDDAAPGSHLQHAHSHGHDHGNDTSDHESGDRENLGDELRDRAESWVNSSLRKLDDTARETLDETRPADASDPLDRLLRP